MAKENFIDSILRELNINPVPVEDPKTFIGEKDETLEISPAERLIAKMNVYELAVSALFEDFRQLDKKMNVVIRYLKTLKEKESGKSASK